MISFALSDEQASAREAMRGFAATALRPNARAYDEAADIPDGFFAQAWELGLTAAQLPEAVGGYGGSRSPATNAIVLEELAHGDASLALAAAAPSTVAYAIADQGSEAQRARYLPPYAGPRYHLDALAVNEPHPAASAWLPRTVAERDGHGWVLSGRKCFVPLGDRAAHFLVVARAGERLDAFLVPRDAAGLTISAAEKNLGLKALPTVSLTLEGVRVTDAERLGEAAGCDVPRVLNQARVATAAVLNGIARAALDYCVPYAKERVAFGEPIARKQSIAFRLAEMQMEVESMRWMIWKAASQLERGLDATRSAHLARGYAAEKTLWITDNGIQVLGGHGFIREHPVEMWYRNARTLGVLEGMASV